MVGVILTVLSITHQSLTFLTKALDKGVYPYHQEPTLAVLTQYFIIHSPLKPIQNI